MVGCTPGVVGQIKKRMPKAAFIRIITTSKDVTVDICGFQGRNNGALIPMSGPVTKVCPPNTFYRTGGGYHTDATGLAACNTVPLSSLADSPFWLTNSTVDIPVGSVYVQIPFTSPSIVEEVGAKIRSVIPIRMQWQGIELLDVDGNVIHRTGPFAYDAANPSAYVSQTLRIW